MFSASITSPGGPIIQPTHHISMKLGNALHRADLLIIKQIYLSRFTGSDRVESSKLFEIWSGHIGKLFSLQWMFYNSNMLIRLETTVTQGEWCWNVWCHCVLTISTFGCRLLGFDQKYILTILQAVPEAGSRLWNSLPPDVTSAPALTVFQNRLKTYLFSCFQFPVLYSMYSSGLAELYLSHSK